MAIGVDGAARLREIYRRQQQLAELAGIETQETNTPESEGGKEKPRPQVPPPSPSLSSSAATPPLQQTALTVTKAKSLVPTLVLAALGLIIAAGVFTAIEMGSVTLANAQYFLPLISGPLSFIGILYLILRPLSQREAHRFSRAVASIRKETLALDEIVTQLSARVESNQQALALQADQLLKVGEQSSERLADIGMNMRAEAVGLQRHTDRLTEATETARESLGPLLDALPEARKQTEELTAILNKANNEAEHQSAVLATHLQTLSELGQKTENTTLAAAERLTKEIEHLDQIQKEIDARLETSASAVAQFGDKVANLIADKMQIADTHIAKMADHLDERIRVSRTALDELAGHLSFNMTARLGEVNEYATRIADNLETHLQTSQTAIVSFNTQISHDFHQTLQAIERQTKQLSEHLKSSIDNSEQNFRHLSEQVSTDFETKLEKVNGRTIEISQVLEKAVDSHHQAFDLLGSSINSDLTQRLASVRNQSKEIVDFFENHLKSSQENLTNLGDNFAEQLTGQFNIIQNDLSHLSGTMQAQQLNAQSLIQNWKKEFTEALSDQQTDVTEHLNTVYAHLAERHQQVESLFTHINALADQADTRFISLREDTDTRLKTLDEGLGHLSDQIKETGAMLMNSDWGLSKLAERARGFSEHITVAVQDIDVRLPAALTRITEQFGENNHAADTLFPKITGMENQAAKMEDILAQASKGLTHQRDILNQLTEKTDRGFEQKQQQIREFIKEVDASNALHHEAFDKLVSDANAQLGGFIQKLGQLSDLMANIQTQNHSLVSKATPALKAEIENVQNLITQTRQEEKTLLASLGTELGESLQKQVTGAVDKALVEKIRSSLSSVDEVAEKSVESARKATERLMQQMLTITNITAGIEKRITEAKEKIENHDERHFTRHVAWLIDALRSKAIDITRIMSADVSDAAWASYLKGDRGVFSRRAVRLLDSGETKIIAREYEKNDSFREHVNRYIHDFEAMLRRVINNRDGTSFSVALMSSDVGKLYTALSQAVEKYRQ
ncbi:MAG: hypothetical protein ABF461_03470 [Zymomonas mobilis subsp. pomaceae]|uniref:Apolipoprotein A1/A4/E n=1 Tax=Zymomonas mobilis subsp. pomaceae (strain ATCC 29192 / DSM 22645 / JCM 10191 / CCUG 17912 / NBRC 13757 / NCIMB 11200 / NRRL B-4491 / Barker I) TaxID=579138 RepID=F8ETY5_ZYMMT|nr:hypothetical protein [Zymomonas mobilis]AEI38082.1 hypothetical protein Zymop_1187 [Zymomonas mobilis subsp. pomaceae ATCC 29192]MDX5949448.1 hypothetical protein [Zymomonas mobilis subsp. pomaceae]GEB89191.1 hypothetical protein ZMO02_08280 [Zymomonas mobilis subsp. pomaceae]